MRKSFKLLALLALSSIFCASISGGAVATSTPVPPSYTLTDLGVLPGFVNSYGTALNILGEVIGYCQTIDNTHQFLYRGGKLLDLTALLGADLYPQFINDEGEIAGYSLANGKTKIFVYRNGEIHYVSPPAGGISISISGFNDLGQMIGLYSDSAGLPHSFLRQPNGRFITLPTVHSTAGNEQFMPNAINILGQIIGNTVVGDPVNGFNSTAFLLPSGGGAPRDLGSLNGGSTFAVGINNLGQIVGSSVVLPETEMGFFITYPFLYSGGKMINIGPTVFSDMFSYAAVAINDSGTIVGTESIEAMDDFGFVYYKGHLYSNLSALVVPNPYPNHFVNQAIGINDFGVILAESQFLQNNNQITTHAVILTPIRHWNQ